MFNRALAVLAVAFSLCFPAMAFGQTATVNISGAFDAPATGTFSGSYVVNTTTNFVLSGSLTTTAGKAEDGVTDLPASTHAYRSDNASDFVTFVSGSPVIGSRGIGVVVTGSLSAPTGTTYFGESVCADLICNANSPLASDRRLASTVVYNVVPIIPPTPVPTLSEWAMILFGGLLAGGAALYVQRRRFV